MRSPDEPVTCTFVGGGVDGGGVGVGGEAQPRVGVLGGGPPGGVVEAVEGGGQRPGCAGAAEGGGVGGGGGCGGITFHRNAHRCARGGVVRHQVAHVLAFSGGSEVRGLCALHGAVVAHCQRRGIRHDVRIAAGERRGEVAEFAP